MFTWANKIISFWKEKKELRKVMRLQKMSFAKQFPKKTKIKKLVVFMLPDRQVISGGILSIFNIAKKSRLILGGDATVIFATYPSKVTHYRNNMFKNNEVIYKFSNICHILTWADETIIHLPEFLSKKFFRKLTRKQRNILKNAKNLQINILNQNIELMPPKEGWKSLLNLTKNVTQTVAHHSYATSEVFEAHGIPLTLIPACIDLSGYEATKFSEKENLIAYSNDTNEHKEKVLQMIKDGLPEYRLIEINKMTFDEYMQTTTRAKYTISFGEGFDGYYGQPHYVGSVGIAVYNDVFFVDEKILEVGNVFKNYDDLQHNFIDFIRKNDIDSEKYEKIVKNYIEYSKMLYDEGDYIQRITNFYSKNYDFINLAY